jgi:hypothetical protein
LLQIENTFRTIVVSFRLPSGLTCGVVGASYPVTAFVCSVFANSAMQKAQREVAMSATFDYSAFSPEDAADLRGIAVEVRCLVKRKTPINVEIGEKLNSAKEKMPHGAFAVFCKLEARVEPRTAQKYMSLARFARAHSRDVVEQLAARTGYKLAETATPPAVIAEVVSEVRAGRAPSHREVAARVATAKRSAAVSRVLDIDKLAGRLLDVLDARDVRDVILLVKKGSPAITLLFCERLASGLQQRRTAGTADEVSRQSPL